MAQPFRASVVSAAGPGGCFMAVMGLATRAAPSRTRPGWLWVTTCSQHLSRATWSDAACAARANNTGTYMHMQWLGHSTSWRHTSTAARTHKLMLCPHRHLPAAVQKNNTHTPRHPTAMSALGRGDNVQLDPCPSSNKQEPTSTQGYKPQHPAMDSTTVALTAVVIIISRWL